ncbi:MAG: nucleoid-associated protein YejK, partial [Enterobacteriaceae bacterium]
VYSSKSRAFAQFEPESQLAIGLSRYRQGDETFIDFSRASVQLLREEISKYPFAEGGIVVFCHYRYLAVEYLLIALLSSCNSMRVNETLELSSTHYLDIAHADVVARIDLTEWQVNPDSNRYVTFLKGRVGRRVADFFLDFLGASEGLNSKAQNRELLQAVNDYCQQEPMAESERLNCQQHLYSYCNGQLQAGEEIELRGVAQVLPVLGEQDFEQFSSSQGYELEQSFPADRSTLRQLTKFSGSGGGMTINFDVGLLGERIFWDQATDTLTIRGTPPNLRDQLQRRSGAKQD